jgi:glycosyltransferase involved in cell wall biosynthesis/GT2 family glycosyltransferase
MSAQADVIIPVYGNVGVTRQCVESVLEHTGPELGQLILINDCSPDRAMQPMLEELRDRDPRILLLSNEKNLGFVATCNRGLSLRRRDAVLLNSDTRVTPGWLAEMLRVLESNERAASVVPLSNNATICSVPEFCAETKAGEVPFEPLALGQSELPPSTVLPTGVGFCLLFKHQVLNMLGLLDPAYGRGYNEENDWCQRALRLGFVTLRANRALVYHLGSISFGDEKTELDRRNARLLHRRFPYYTKLTQLFSAGPEARAPAAYVRRKLGTVSVCLDLSHLPPDRLNGTGVYGFELLRALKAQGELDLWARVGSDEQALVAQALGARPHPAGQPLDRFSVYHRPAQIFADHDLKVFLNAPCHTVISYLDLIAYRAPQVFHEFDQFRRYRAFSYTALKSAQAVIGISDHNRREIIEEFGLPPERVHTTHLGVDAGLFKPRPRAATAATLKAHGVKGPYLLSAGSDYAHKNLMLLMAAYALFRAGFEQSGEQGPCPSLLLMGPATHSGGSLYARARVWPEGVRYLGAVPEHDVRGLMEGALAFIYPSAYEGFGFPPAEAMALGTPVIASSLTSVQEIVGDAALLIRDFTPEEIAGHMLAVARSEALRAQLVEKGRRQVARFTWAETARRTTEVYLAAIDRPAAESLQHRQMMAQLLA